MTASIGLLAAHPANAETFVVNSTGDDGDRAPPRVCNTAPFPVGTEPECTLRAAIQEANATTEPDNIDFNIGGSGIKTISPGSLPQPGPRPLPPIEEPVDVNGYSELGASANTLALGDNAVLRIRIDGLSKGNSVLVNSIFSNARLGIDLGGNGVTPNDGAGDADTDPNDLQNFPVLTFAQTGQQATTIRGTLESIPAEGYFIRFFKNPGTTKDQGKTFIGEKFVTDPDGDGIMSFTFRPTNRVAAGLFVTATATHPRDASEFSAPRKVLTP